MAERSWNEDWEECYGEWIQGDITPGLLQPTGLKADCADLVYALRAIFSRDNRLPFMASLKTGERYGHFSREWDRLPVHPDWRKDERFCTFLADLFRDVVSTRSLYRDTYPVALFPEVIRPGLMIFEDRIAPHVVSIGQVKKENDLPVVYYESFLPGYDRFFISHNTDIRIYGHEIPIRHSGVVRWNWPVEREGRWKYISDDAMPYYSLEQYSSAFPYHNHIRVLLNRLAYERLYGKPFNELTFLQEFSVPLIDSLSLWAHRIPQVEPSVDLRASPLKGTFNQRPDIRDIDERLDSLLQQTWPVLRGYGISRSRLEEHLSGIELDIASNLPPVSANSLLQSFERGDY